MNPSAPMLPVRAVRFCLGLAALGWLAMVVGWYQAAGRLRVEDQVAWAVLSVAGTTAVGLVTVLLVLAGRRAVEQRLRGVLDAVAEDRKFDRLPPWRPTPRLSWWRPTAWPATTGRPAG